MSLFVPVSFFVDTALITVTDDGDFAPNSGTTTNTHTYTSKTSTGPDTIVCITWFVAAAPDNGGATLSSATWNSVGCAIREQATRVRDDGGGDFTQFGAAIVSIPGAQSSSSLVLGFNKNVADSEITILSLANASSLTPTDTDESTGSDPLSLTSLASPGTGGVRIAVYCNASDGSAVSWTNGTEVADIDAGSFRHSAAYDLGDDAGTITADGGAGDAALVGISIR